MDITRGLTLSVISSVLVLITLRDDTSTENIVSCVATVGPIVALTMSLLMNAAPKDDSLSLTKYHNELFEMCALVIDEIASLLYAESDSSEVVHRAKGLLSDLRNLSARGNEAASEPKKVHFADKPTSDHSPLGSIPKTDSFDILILQIQH
jgi:hypothetical protein